MDIFNRQSSGACSPTSASSISDSCPLEGSGTPFNSYFHEEHPANPGDSLAFAECLDVAFPCDPTY